MWSMMVLTSSGLMVNGSMTLMEIRSGNLFSSDEKFALCCINNASITKACNSYSAKAKDKLKSPGFSL